jgi:tetratricopeptide (TPR) repeat protein
MPARDDTGETRPPGEATVPSTPTTMMPVTPAPPPAGDAYGELVTVEREHYVVRGELATGGMGRILEAYDRRLGRTVALKELLVARPDLRARFEREARITARLQHPSIVSVLEAGAWPDGEPFYAMKLVRGESLGKAIARRETLDERLALVPNVIAAVDALAYAHSERVIHRDLKPSNVLVGDFGETVVIDWGLAKEVGVEEREVAGTGAGTGTGTGTGTGSSGGTEAGAVMGTPAYMPPEQARGDSVDERADVYALGAMLYHVLAGAPPFSGATSKEVLAAVVAGRVQPLAIRAPGAPRELVTIVEKAMASVPARRYPSARELADDLKKFQTGQLVSAHAYSRRELFARWLRRHRAPIAVAGVALAILATAGVVAVQRILREEARTRAEREAAEQHRRDAEDLMSFMLFDLRDKLKPLNRLDLLGAVAKKAVAYYAARPEDPGADPADERRRATALANLGDVLVAQGDTKGALAEYQASLAIRRRLAARAPGDDDLARDLYQSQTAVGSELSILGDSKGARAAFEAASAMAEARAKRRPDDLMAQRDLAFAHEKLGGLRVAQGDSGGLDELRAMTAIRERIAARVPNDGDRLRELVIAHIKVGDVLVTRSDLAGALAEFQKAVAVGDRLVTLGPTPLWHNIAAAAHERVGRALLWQGAAADALVEMRKGLAIDEQLAAADPTNAGWLRDVAVTDDDVAGALAALGDTAGALAAYRESVTKSEQLVALDPSNAEWQLELSGKRDDLADALEAAGDEDESIRVRRSALAIRDRLVAQDPSDTRKLLNDIGTHIALGSSLRKIGDVPGAIAEQEHAVVAAAKLAAIDPGDADFQAQLAEAHLNLGNAALAGGDARRAVAETELAIPILDRLAAADPDDVDMQSRALGAHWDLGRERIEEKDAAGAQAELQRALAGYQALAQKAPKDARWPTQVLEVQMSIAGAHLAAHDAAAAVRESRAARASAEALAAKDPSSAIAQLDLCDLLEGLGDAEAAAGDADAARAAYRDALAIAERNLAAHPKDAGWQRRATRLRGHPR